MKTIHKYTFKIEDEVSIEMPKGARILSVQCQDDIPVMWALVDTENELETRLFNIFGTGEEIWPSFDYSKEDHLATFQHGIFVWHIFLT